MVCSRRALWRVCAIILSIVFVVLAPVCFASFDGGTHAHHQAFGAAVSHHAAMYQSFAYALLVFAFVVCIAYLWTTRTRFEFCTAFSSGRVLRLPRQYRDPGVIHRMRFSRWLSLFLVSPPRSA